MKTSKRTLLTAGISIAMALTLSCSGGENSDEFTGSSNNAANASCEIKPGAENDYQIFCDNKLVGSLEKDENGINTGANGKSAYEIAVDNGFTGTEIEWLASLKGEPGPIGPQGPQGDSGEFGELGEGGLVGIGKDGADGNHGKDGTSCQLETPGFGAPANAAWEVFCGSISKGYLYNGIDGTSCKAVDVGTHIEIKCGDDASIEISKIEWCGATLPYNPATHFCSGGIVISKGFVDYPMSDGKRAAPGGVTRYWDGCKPTCSYPQNTDFMPYAKTCDRNGNEMPLFYLSPANYIPPWLAMFLSTPNACNLDNRTSEWPLSETYVEWKAQNPDFPSGAQAGGYVCTKEQIPYAVNDTLAYAFAAVGYGNCGKCFMLQFDTENWAYGDVRPTHRALKGKTLIVMANNTGVGEGAFDIMIPGGGVGAYNAVSEQLGLSEEKLGYRWGGLLTECTIGTKPSPYNSADFSQNNYAALENGLGVAAEMASLEETQECLRQKCNRAFANHPDHLKGCLWHADWFMAADIPEAFYKEVDCPKYLTDRYGSSFPLPSRPETLNPDAVCEIDGKRICK